MLDVKVAKLKNTGENMEANNKLEEVNTEPVIQLIIPGGSGQEKVVSVTRKKAMTLAGIFAVVFVCMAGAAGFYGWQYHHSKIDRAAYQEYLDHKSEQEAKIQSLLDDNEKMLRDMSEIHTLETKLRRAVIHLKSFLIIWRIFTLYLSPIWLMMELILSAPSTEEGRGPSTAVSTGIRVWTSL